MLDERLLILSTTLKYNAIQTTRINTHFLPACTTQSKRLNWTPIFCLLNIITMSQNHCVKGITAIVNRISIIVSIAPAQLIAYVLC
jgi:hypothetical protein